MRVLGSRSDSGGAGPGGVGRVVTADPQTCLLWGRVCHGCPSPGRDPQSSVDLLCRKRQRVWVVFSSPSTRSRASILSVLLDWPGLRFPSHETGSPGLSFSLGITLSVRRFAVVLRFYLFGGLAAEGMRTCSGRHPERWALTPRDRDRSPPGAPRSEFQDDESALTSAEVVSSRCISVR